MKLAILWLLQLHFKSNVLIVIQQRIPKARTDQFNINNTNSKKRRAHPLLEMMRGKLIGPLFQKKPTKEGLWFVLV